jgi:hypothetical protein
VRAHLAQETQPFHDSVVQVDQFRFAEFLDLYLHRAFLLQGFAATLETSPSAIHDGVGINDHFQSSRVDTLEFPVNDFLDPMRFSPHRLRFSESAGKFHPCGMFGFATLSASAEFVRDRFDP